MPGEETGRTAARRATSKTGEGMMMRRGSDASRDDRGPGGGARRAPRRGSQRRRERCSRTRRSTRATARGWGRRGEAWDGRRVSRGGEGGRCREEKARGAPKQARRGIARANARRELEARGEGGTHHRLRHRRSATRDLERLPRALARGCVDAPRVHPASARSRNPCRADEEPTRAARRPRPRCSRTSRDVSGPPGVTLSIARPARSSSWRRADGSRTRKARSTRSRTSSTASWPGTPRACWPRTTRPRAGTPSVPTARSALGSSRTRPRGRSRASTAPRRPPRFPRTRAA